jgi:hypothetical protein
VGDATGKGELMDRGQRRWLFDRACKRAARWAERVGALKFKTMRVVNGIWEVEYFSEEEKRARVRMLAEVHCRGCSCLNCRNHKSVPPRRERGFEMEISE